MYIYIFVLMAALLLAYGFVTVRAMQGETLAFRLGGREVQLKKKWALAALFCGSALPLGVLSGLRYDIGVDYFYTYVPLYQRIADGASMADAGTEPAFYLLVKAIQLLGGGTVWMFLLTALLTVGLFWIGFYHSSDNFVLSVLLFVACETYFVSLMYVRQMLAAAVLFYGLRYIREKSFPRYAVCVVVAFLFHKSAILFLPLYLLGVVAIHPLVLVGGIAVLSLLHGPLRQVINWVILQTDYAWYVGSAYAPAFRFYYAKLLQYGLLFVVACLMYRQLKEDRLYRFCLNALAVLVYLTTNFNVMPQSDRMCWYLEIVNLLLLPMVVTRCQNKWLKPVLLAGLVAVFAIVTVDNVFINGAHGVVPYRFVFAPSAVIW